MRGRQSNDWRDNCPYVTDVVRWRTSGIAAQKRYARIGCWMAKRTSERQSRKTSNKFLEFTEPTAWDGVIPQYHTGGLKKCEAIEATTHTTKTPIATRPTCLDIRSILACKTSASTEALSVVCSLACSKVPDLSADQRVGSMIFAIPQLPLNEH
jgi:hypothetical protein